MVLKSCIIFLKALRKIFIRLGFVFWLISAVVVGFAQSDTLWRNPYIPQPEIKWKHQYHQTLVMKLFLSQAMYDGKYKRKDNGESKVYCTIEEALKIIKKVDYLTLGIPKIIYLVGWQYNGHDSKYPAWFEGNIKLKRPQDSNTLESIQWLMEEAKKYNTIVSLHINMFDAYEDSPLFDEYVRNDIISKNKDGSLREGEWGYPVSYAQEWKTGFAQKRIDSLCQLLPIQDAGTIHIDAFHSWAPIGEKGPGERPFIKGPISPYLGFTPEQETVAQKKIFKYWASKRIDVTSEGATFLRLSAFEGLQPMAWWVDWDVQKYLDWPAAYYTGGTDRRDIGKLFGTSIHGEDIFKNDPENLSGFLKEFCTNTLPWYFLNRLKRLYFTFSTDTKTVVYSENVQTMVDNKNFSLIQNGKKYMENGDVFLPALWLKEPGILAFSDLGFQNKTWSLPAGFNEYKEFNMYEITMDGNQFIQKIKCDDGKATFSLKPGEGVVFVPTQQ